MIIPMPVQRPRLEPKVQADTQPSRCPVDRAQRSVSQGHRMTCWAGLVNGAQETPFYCDLYLWACKSATCAFLHVWVCTVVVWSTRQCTYCRVPMLLTITPMSRSDFQGNICSLSEGTFWWHTDWVWAVVFVCVCACTRACARAHVHLKRNGVIMFSFQKDIMKKGGRWNDRQDIQSLLLKWHVSASENSP